ncbi:kinase-like protein [Aaosphaeria arxii CBS 175.79]|uniref:Kinase-like protein n=1 Tax=Aaosphaeria arxii CBS 175.79 TaxID=1450172 RepID=A0A6A5XY61_9PLEO|nr:kinase-like protein [Aaosphaeria arxii CBS 175.79]KAF2017863.1 kinase-like protein [Aaosphaeria arxii CBS 175.79]
MVLSWISRLFSPTFAWPHRVLHSVPLASSLPAVPQLWPRHVRRMTGCLHALLRRFSIVYCGWYGIQYDHYMVQLPFGLILKWTTRTRLEEVVATKLARSAGFPVPLIISYGEHEPVPGLPPTRVSILMTRLPGAALGDVHKELPPEQLQTICSELRTMLETMREWKHPQGGQRVCSISGTSIVSARVPDHIIGPCESESDFNKQLLAPARPGRKNSKEKFARVKKLHAMQHSIVFTHGDLKHHNLLVHDGHVPGFIDWESAGWCPEYWEFTTALKFCSEDFWWYDFNMKLGASRYMEELEYERALTGLTSGSYSFLY